MTLRPQLFRPRDAQKAENLKKKKKKRDKATSYIDKSIYQPLEVFKNLLMAHLDIFSRSRLVMKKSKFGDTSTC